MVKDLRVTVNGVEMEAVEGQTVLQFLNNSSIEVPQVCYHPSLGPIETCDTCIVDINLKRFIGSCCGKGRQFYFYNDVKTAKTILTKLTITPYQCHVLMKQLQESSAHFQKTGGAHNAALCTTDGIVITRTDIGRHNALDKLFGYCLIHGIPLKDKIIAFSGRISSEVLLKAAKIGVAIILSKSAPTNLALDLAEDLGITAIGFIRGGGFNVYTHQERILGLA
ncbi:formate dehydrogenase accessory protein FdhD [Neobacillus bataviensis]|uniref:Formate dehydrogenase accessory protein FdhD n=1 Tax=Neobacillus bataviensis TaxID=220685 RepID=A0A561CZA0_9BACI|nr:formate dehydrogenase accessory sulfurtransferase FdhD [Neobacillus bataviensis]TWD96525.1 formate dehydrogenase accessory protein FdhD [Neobacillus bataviensis]